MPIDSVRKGDLVVGGSGKFRKVIGTHARAVDEELVSIVAKGAMATCTPNHRFCTPRGWVEARSLHEGDIIIQAGENSTLHLAVHAITNMRTLLRYGLMAFVRKRKAVAPLTVDDQVEGGNKEIDNVTSKKLSLLEWKAYCHQVISYDFLAFAQWCTECAHALWMEPASGKGILQRLCFHVRTKKSRACFQFLGYATNEAAVGLGLALAYMKAFGSKLMVGLRKSLTSLLPSVGIAYPLGSDRITAMPDGDAKMGKDTMHGSSIDAPMGGEPSEAALLSEVPAFCGIEDIHAFDGFDSFFGFLKNTFFHNRYVLVEGKVTKKKRETTVYNLSIYKDESYIVPIGITHNCRCTVERVLRGKYRETPHQEAMQRGDEALNGERYNIFRFNSGIQQKTMPPYNPYTIRRCNDCDIAKGKGVVLAFVPENELCAACKIVRACIKDDTKQTKRKAKNLQGSYITNDGLKSEVSISKNSIKEWVNQPFKYVNEKNKMLLNIKSVFKDAVYLGTADNHKGTKDVLRSHIFETQVKDIKAYIIVREYSWGELILHSISEGGKLLEHIKRK